ncbi:MAG: alanine racemase [Lachnospiraceae bacterium]|nr:alanine racemase [Lachnospiraceae bacterium]
MLNDMQICDIAQKYGTPSYLFDLSELSSRVKRIKELLGEEVELCYAMKANPFLTFFLDEYVDKFEVCSFGEYEICKKYEICSSKIVYSGVYKQCDELMNTVKDDFDGDYTIESKKQFEELCNLIHETKRHARILLRLTSGNQFGMDEEEIIAILSRIDEMPYIEFAGIQFFSGTQKKNIEIVERELTELDAFCTKVKIETGKVITRIEYGAGLFVDYFGDEEADFDDLIKMREWLQKRQYHFVIELGRYIVATCGKYLTKIVDIKKNKGKRYCMIDGGIHQINYYGQMLGLRVPPVRQVSYERKQIGESEKWTVCGALCTVHDVVLREYEMQNPCEGDLLLFEMIGAYSVTEASFLFLSRELPNVLAIDEKGQVKVLRKQMSTAHINSGGETRKPVKKLLGVVDIYG